MPIPDLSSFVQVRSFHPTETRSGAMKTITFLLGVVLFVGGVLLGLWVGLWWAFVGGITAFVAAVRDTNSEPIDFALAVLRTFSGGFLGYLAASLGVVPGSLLIQGSRCSGTSTPQRYGLRTGRDWHP